MRRALLVGVAAPFLVLPAQLLHARQPADTDDVRATLRSCRVIQISFNNPSVQLALKSLREKGMVPVDDDESAAEQACSALDGALSTSDPSKVKTAVSILRPILSRLGLPPSSPREQLAALEKKASGLSAWEFYDELPELAKRAFNAGDIDKAETYSTQLLSIAHQNPKNRNYGNALYYGNFVLGRLAVQRGNLRQADQYLLAAGATPGSPQLDTFGPNMSLAKDLLEKGHSDVVLQFLSLCHKFWDSGRQLDEWSEDVRRGQIPDFGSNLRY